MKTQAAACIPAVLENMSMMMPVTKAIGGSNTFLTFTGSASRILRYRNGVNLHRKLMLFRIRTWIRMKIIKRIVCLSTSFIHRLFIHFLKFLLFVFSDVLNGIYK